MATYVRQSSFSDGDTITAALFNNEFNQLVNAFSVTGGHTHDGSTAGDGGPISNLFSNSLVFGTNSNTDIAITFNATTNDGVLTWKEDEDYFEFSDDLLIATTEKIQFRDTAIYINSSADGQLDLVADTEIQIAATTIDMNGNADISGNLGIGGNLTVTGTTTFNGGTITMGDAATDNVVFGADVDSNIIPDDDNTYDLGSSTQEWKDLYIDGVAYVDAINFNGTAITATAAELNIMDGVTSTAAELNILDGVTSTAAELNILDGVTSTAAELNILDGVTSTAAELNILDGVTASATDINLIDGITNGTVIASKAIITDSNKDITGGRNITISGELDAGSLDVSGDVDVDGTLETDALSINGTVVTSTAAELNILDGVTASATDINLIDGITNGTVIASKAIITDSNKDITGGRNITISGELDAATLDVSGNVDIDGVLETDGLSINGTTVTSTAAELNILDGVTSTAAELNLLDGKAFLDEDDMSSNSATGIASQQSIKAYVDTQITAEDLDITTDSGTIAIDLDSETLTVSGGTGLDSSATGNAVTLAIDSTVATLTGSQTLTNKSLTAPTLTGTAVVASLDISGDIDVDGTTNLDVVDIDGAVDMASTLSVTGAITGTLATAAQPNITSVGTLTGLTTTGDINLGDDDKAIFGAGSDLQIYHDGSNSYVNEQGTGSLYLNTTNGAGVFLTSAGENLAQFNSNGAVTLYHDNSAKLATASGGVTVTGTLVSDSLTVDTTTLVVDASNNRVGIGTASPSATLSLDKTGVNQHRALDLENDDITYSMYIDQDNNNSDTWSLFDTTNSQTASRYYPSSSGYWQFFTNGSERMRIDSSGRVGIGTTSPSNPLHLLSTQTDFSPSFLIKNSSTANGSIAALRFSAGSSSTGFFIGKHSEGHGDANAVFMNQETNAPIAFSTNNTERMRIDSSGMLLVNTTSSWGGETTPHIESRGDVAGDYTGLIVSNTNDAASDSVSVNFGLARDGGLVFGNAGKISVGKEQDWTSTASTVDGFMSFSTMQNESLTERMRIDSSGRVGIAQDAPGDFNAAADDLVIGNSGGDFGMTIRTGTSSNGSIHFADGTTGDAPNRGIITYDHSDDHMQFNVAAAERMRITSAGKLFVGTTAAVRGSEHISVDAGSADIIAGKTHAAGMVLRKASFTNGFLLLFERDDNGFAVGQITSNGTSTTYTTSSDYRLKENIEPMQNGLDRVKQLNPVKFEWKQTGLESEGFIAHEVDEIYSECINGEKDGERMQTMDYGRITPLLVKAIQEQQTQIDALQSEINELKNS